MQSPFTCGTPGTRPAPRKMAKPLRDLGDPNLEATQLVDETFNMSTVKVELDETITQEPPTPAGVSSTACFADPNIEESFVERRSVMCGEIVAQVENLNFPRPSEEYFAEPLVLPEVVLPDQSRLKSHRKSTGKSGKFVRGGDSNLEDSTMESTMYDMDVTQTDETVKENMRCTYQTTLALLEDEGDTTLKNEEPNVTHVVDDTFTKIKCEADVQEQGLTQEEAPLKGDSVFASVEAVVLCERKGTSPLKEEGPSLATELLAVVEEKTAAMTEVAGSVNVSILGVDAPGSPRKETFPCISGRPSDFSFTSAVRSSVSTGGGDDVKPLEEESFTYVRDFNETELVFAEPLKVAGDSDHEKSERSSSESNNAAVVNDFVMDSTIDDTMMVLCQPAKVTACPAEDDVFPAHYGTSEVEDRFSQAEESLKVGDEETVTEASAVQSSPEAVAITLPDTVNVVRAHDVLENLNTEAMLSEPSPIAVASEDVEELPAGDIQSGSSDRMMDGGVSARSSAIPRYMSPILDGAQRATISFESCMARCCGSEASSPAPSQRRKYNMNDSEISFMINEIKVLNEEEERRSKTPSADDQLKENLAQLEAEKAELYESLRAVSAEFDKFKQQSAEQDSALAEAKKKLTEMEKAKEHAERSVADYEFIVTDLKKRHNKQKEDLHAKLLTQEGELERLRAANHAQADLTCTSAGLSTELALTHERLLLSEDARAAAEKRCQELIEELEEATKSAVTSMALSEEVTTANRDLAAMRSRLAELEKELLDREEAMLTANRRHAEECAKLQQSLDEAVLANRSTEGMAEDLRTKLVEAESEKTLMREIQMASEMDLMKATDELKALKRSLDELQEREEARKEAILQRDAAEQELNDLRNELKEKSEYFDREAAQMRALKEKCSAFEEQLETEKLAREVANREIVQLRDENYAITEALNKASNALMDAESRAAAAEGHLTDHIKCHTEELNLRVTELEKMVAAGLADKQALTSELEEKIEKQTALTNEVKKAGEVISKLETEVTDAHKEKTALMEEVKLGKQLYEEKAAEAEKVVTEFAGLQSTLKSLEGERDEFKEQLLTAVAKAEKNEAISKEVVESLKTQIATLAAERDSLKSSLAAVEDCKANLEKNLAELKECMSESQAELAKLTTMSTKMEEEWKEREQVYKEKITAAEEAVIRVPQLESTIEYLKSEAEALDHEIREKNSMLELEVISRQKATTALAALEEKYLSLQEAKKELEKEYEQARKQFDLELGTAQKAIEELKKAMAMLEDRTTAEESAANEKIEAANAEIARLEAELRKSKAAQAEAELEMTRHRQKAEEAMERYLLLESKLAEASSEVSEQNSRALEAEIKELKRVNERQLKEIDRLGNLCDEFDEIEANYRQKVFTLIRERDQLKAQLEPLATPEIPNLRGALTDGVQMLTPETTLIADNMAETKLKELEKIVEKLTEDNRRLEQLRTIEDTKMAKEIEELRRLCRLQENRIAELEKLCDDADESEDKLRRRITELEKEISGHKVSPLKTKVRAPGLLDALRHRELDEDREEERIEAGKEAPYVSAPSSPHLLQKSLDQPAGPMFEESVVESSATPNRSLHTTLYKRLDKTTKLSDTPESKANTSRCAQQ